MKFKPGDRVITHTPYSLFTDSRHGVIIRESGRGYLVSLDYMELSGFLLFLSDELTPCYDFKHGQFEVVWI